MQTPECGHFSSIFHFLLSQFFQGVFSEHQYGGMLSTERARRANTLGITHTLIPREDSCMILLRGPAQKKPVYLGKTHIYLTTGNSLNISWKHYKIPKGLCV